MNNRPNTHDEHLAEEQLRNCIAKGERITGISLKRIYFPLIPFFPDQVALEEVRHYLKSTKGELNRRSREVESKMRELGKYLKRARANKQHSCHKYGVQLGLLREALEEFTVTYRLYLIRNHLDKAFTPKYYAIVGNNIYGPYMTQKKVFNISNSARNGDGLNVPHKSKLIVPNKDVKLRKMVWDG